MLNEALKSCEKVLSAYVIIDVKQQGIKELAASLSFYLFHP